MWCVHCSLLKPLCHFSASNEANFVFIGLIWGCSTMGRRAELYCSSETNFSLFLLFPLPATPSFPAHSYSADLLCSIGFSVCQIQGHISHSCLPARISHVPPFLPLPSAIRWYVDVLRAYMPLPISPINIPTIQKRGYVANYMARSCDTIGTMPTIYSLVAAPHSAVRQSIPIAASRTNSSSPFLLCTSENVSWEYYFSQIFNSFTNFVSPTNPPWDSSVLFNILTSNSSKTGRTVLQGKNNSWTFLS